MTNYGKFSDDRYRLTYQTWYSMNWRCNKKEGHFYKYYGSRGITVDERWQGKQGFKNFLDDMGLKPDGLSIDRIDNEKGYSPSNCRWATPREQSNNVRNNTFMTVDGKKQTLSMWARELGTDPYVVRRQSVKGQEHFEQWVKSLQVK